MKVLLTLSLLLILFATHSTAQTCGTCATNITDYDGSSYTVTAGQTLCIDSLGNFEGQIVLSGGTLCVKGLFKPQTFTFNSGTLVNSGSVNLATLTLGSGKVLQNLVDGLLSVSGNFTLLGGQLTNTGILSVRQTLTNTSGTFTNSGIINCNQLSGTNAISNTGVLNTN